METHSIYSVLKKLFHWARSETIEDASKYSSWYNGMME